MKSTNWAAVAGSIEDHAESAQPIPGSGRDAVGRVGEEQDEPA